MIGGLTGRMLHNGLNAAVLNHVLVQNPAAQQALMPWSGRVVRVVIAPLSTTLRITEQGQFSAADVPPDAVVRVTTDGLFRRIRGQEPIPSDIEIEGESNVALAVARVFGQLQWDWAEDVARILGDTAVTRLESGVRQWVTFQRTFVTRALAQGVDYWRDERALLAQTAAVAAWSSEVDQLRDAVARIQKRIEHLEQRTAHGE